MIGSSASSHEPRLQAASVPIVVPTTKLITVAKPTSITVHQMCWAMMCVTGTLPRLSE